MKKIYYDLMKKREGYLYLSLAGFILVGWLIISSFLFSEYKFISLIIMISALVLALIINFYIIERRCKQDGYQNLS